MTFDLNLFSSKLKKYRKELKTSLDDISSSTGISILDLTKLETAQRKPTGDEVLILADYYQCDYQFFISNRHFLNRNFKFLFRKCLLKPMHPTVSELLVAIEKRSTSTKLNPYIFSQQMKPDR